MSESLEDAVATAVGQYVEACRTCDITQLREVFHPNAQMIGYLGPDLLTGSPEPFFEAVAANPPPGANYESSIDNISVAGRVAQATLRERNYMGFDFTNYFQLLHSDGSWRIVSKCFEHS